MQAVAHLAVLAVAPKQRGLEAIAEIGAPHAHAAGAPGIQRVARCGFAITRDRRDLSQLDPALAWVRAFFYPGGLLAGSEIVGIEADADT